MSSSAKRVEELRGEIRRLDRLYYVEATPAVSDLEYDRILQELRDLEAPLGYLAYHLCLGALTSCIIVHPCTFGMAFALTHASSCLSSFRLGGGAGMSTAAAARGWHP